MGGKKPQDYKTAIRAWGGGIYESIPIGHPDLWIPTPYLEVLLNGGLCGLNLTGYPLRTRSKIVKSAACEALGYPVPKTFKKTQPRFLGQQFDTYTQKSNNLQIWNEELSPTRRYAVIRLSDDDIVLRVKVVNGQTLAMHDTTGTITTKYQANISPGRSTHELVSALDTSDMQPYAKSDVRSFPSVRPTDEPDPDTLLPIAEVFRRLSPLVGQSFRDPGTDQERNRGAALHERVCRALGYDQYGDSGQFPDIRHQLLEVKLQTSPTIDLGLVLPNSIAPLDTNRIGKHQPRHCDTRYALFCGNSGTEVGELNAVHVCCSILLSFKRIWGWESNRGANPPGLEQSGDHGSLKSDSSFLPCSVMTANRLFSVAGFCFCISK